MNRALITEIMKKFLEGTCNDEEFAYLLHWYESFDENPAPDLSEEDKALCRSNIIEKIYERNPELKVNCTSAKEKRKIIMQISTWWKYAAAAVIIGLIAWGGFHYYNRSSGEVAERDLAINSPIRLENRSNRIHQVILPDSSIVWLSPNSRIEYPENFFDRERQVHLAGEAFFEIAKDPLHPFVVTSGNLVTRVLGTSFLLKAYSNDPVEVTVLTGKIEVCREDKEADKVTLTEHEKVVLNTNGDLVKLSATADNTGLQWNKVNLSFDNIPLNQVIKELNQKFSVHIYCKDKKIEQYRLNADFNNQNLADIMELLEKSLNIHYEIENDNTINLYSNNN